MKVTVNDMPSNIQPIIMDILKCNDKSETLGKINEAQKMLRTAHAQLANEKAQAVDKEKRKIQMRMTKISRMHDALMWKALSLSSSK